MCSWNALLSSVLTAPAVRRVGARAAIPADYFERQTRRAPAFEQITDRVFAYRHGIDRSLVLETGDGIAVVDSYHADMATALREELRHRFGTKRVRWLLYSHYHLDHVRGGTVLDPVEVIVHAKAPVYWRDFDTTDVATPTRTITGDQHLHLGELELDLLDLGHSHTDTLYAFHLPGQQVLFPPDAAWVRAVPPFGLPDFYHPGYLRALDRLTKLDVAHLITTHSDNGTKADLVAFRTFMHDSRALVEQALNAHGGLPTDGRTVRAVFDDVHPVLRQRYGHWHGFDAMFLPHLVRHVGGVYLGH
jgi:glyoxylase-like metal-dependent hydrolase (beta-lactamase superfamily II)